jgi:hypothetical protein
MSVMTTSMRDAERDLRSGPVDADPPARDEDGNRFDKLDEVIDAAVDKIMARQAEPPKPERKEIESLQAFDEDKQRRRFSLDKHLTPAFERAEVDNENRSTIEKTSAARNEFRSRYPDRDIGAFLDGMGGLDKKLRETQGAAAEEIARHYLNMPVNVAMRGKADEEAGIDPDAPAGVKLDAHIERAMAKLGDRDLDARDLQGLEQHRAVLERLFPGKPLHEAFAEAVALDRELARDPLGVASRLAAQYGAPVTPREVAHENSVNQTVSMLEQLEASGLTPHARTLQRDIEAVINHPEFQRSGDPAADFVAAHDFAVQLASQGRSAAQELAVHEFNAIGASTDARGNPRYPNWHEVKQEMIQLVAGDKAKDWDQAYAMATKGKIEKARRAAPIRTSSGGHSGSSSQPHGLDEIISAAMG